MVFSLQRERVFYVNICILVCDCYFGLLILLIILLRTQQVVSEPSANNKVYMMKKLFNLKKAESTPLAQHLNEFNTITNQLSTVGIEFDDEVRALILLASLPNSWEAMRMTVSNSAGKSKLKYDDI